MSLRAAAGLRRRQYWHIRRNRPAGRHVELTQDVVDRTIDDSATTPDPAPLSGAALLPYVNDCLAELTETQAKVYALIADGYKEADVAEALGLHGRKAVQAQRHAAEHTISMFAQVVHAGRLCGKRAVAISDYATGLASNDNVRRAQAHLASCDACAATFRATERELRRQVAALIPGPALALAATERRGGIGGIFSRFTDLLPVHSGGGRIESVRETALGMVVRSPASAETLTGAGLGGTGLIVGTKAVIGLCALTIAGSAAVCSSLGGLPDGLNIRQPATQKHAEKHNPVPVVRSTVQTSTTSALVTPVLPTITQAATTSRTRPDPAAQAAATARNVRIERKRAQATRRRAAQTQAAASNPLQAPAPAVSAAAAAAPPTQPSLAPVAPKSSPKNATPSPALTGGSNPLQGRTP